MTSPLSEIQRLIEKWRVEVRRLSSTHDQLNWARAQALANCIQELEESAALRSALGAAPEKEALNIDGEPLHTGDDDRIDCLTGIRAGLEEIVNAEDDEYEKHEIIELVRELFDDCDQLYALLIETIASERSALSAAPHWQPIETAPKDGTPVLVWTADVGQEGLTEFASVCSYHSDAGFCTHELMVATHWMPLPPSSTREE